MKVRPGATAAEMKPAILLQMLLETSEEESGILLMTKNIHLQILKRTILVVICVHLRARERPKNSALCLETQH